MKSAVLTVTLSAVMLLSACDKKPPPAPVPPPPPPPAPAVPAIPVTTGILDYSRWSKWVQERPRIRIVSSIDAPTEKLIADQIRIFTTLVSPPPDSAALATGDVQAQLDAVKSSFPAKRQTYSAYVSHPIDVPHHERWDSYRRTVSHATLTNLPALITQIENKIAGDLRDLELQLGSQGAAGAQARMDSAWLKGGMTKVLENLKKIGKSSFVSPTSPAEKAREEWTEFEATELPLIQKVIDANTLAEVPLEEDGSFWIEGRGQPVAVIKVAGRQLYFPLKQPGALRFFNMATTTR